MGKTFKPLLAPNDLLTLDAANELSKNDYFVQTKIDGLRGVVIDGVIKTRSMKEHGNKALPSMFKELLALSQQTGLYLDGEFYSETVEFNELSGIIRSFEKPLPDDLKFILFDVYNPSNPEMAAVERYNILTSLYIPSNAEVIGVHAWPEDFHVLFNGMLAEGHEGLMVKSRKAAYKFGRATYKQGITYKIKPYVTFDLPIEDFVQATVVREGAEKTTNELGRSVTSKKKDDRVLIESCSAVWVIFEGKRLKVSLASLTHEQRKEVWENKATYFGKMIEFKGMMVGAKDLPRHPMFVRWRKDKDK